MPIDDPAQVTKRGNRQRRPVDDNRFFRSLPGHPGRNLRKRSVMLNNRQMHHPAVARTADHLDKLTRTGMKRVPDPDLQTRITGSMSLA